jgi:AIPR protein.
MNLTIKTEVDSFPSNPEYRNFAGEGDNYIFNAVAARSIFFKDPSHALGGNDLADIVVDGPNDNGIDCILTDPTSDYGDLVFLQCKYYEHITLQDLKEAISKMIAGYKLIKSGHTEQFSPSVAEQYTRCLDNCEEGSKIRFCIATSAPRSGIRNNQLTAHFRSMSGDLNIVMDDSDIYFESELESAINDAKALRPSVENGKLLIDEANNCLEYQDGVVINISALSLKKLYAQYRNNLLSQNLRYFVKQKTIDKDVEQSIKDTPEEFWYKNNGITIMCDHHEISGRELKLQSFSIINGGQTTKKIAESEYIDENNDFYLICRVIDNPYGVDEDKQKFIYEISKATNSQKAIKPSDLKANNPEQILFAERMKANGVLYKTKRGMEIPSGYKEQDKNCDLPKVGKLALAGVFLMPGSARNKPSVIFDEQKDYYSTIFNASTMIPMSKYISDLLYVDYFFDKSFIQDYRNGDINEGRKRFAGNCRTLATAFVGFFAKKFHDEFSRDDLVTIGNANVENEDELIRVQKILRKMLNTQMVFVPGLNSDQKDEGLKALFKYVIRIGFQQYRAYSENQSPDDKVDETNWLKRDSSFYKILKSVIDDFWDSPDNLNAFKYLFAANTTN